MIRPHDAIGLPPALMTAPPAPDADDGATATPPVQGAISPATGDSLSKLPPPDRGEWVQVAGRVRGGGAVRPDAGRQHSAGDAGGSRRGGMPLTSASIAAAPSHTHLPGSAHPDATVRPGAARPAANSAKADAPKVVAPEIRFIRLDGESPAQRLVAASLKQNADQAAGRTATPPAASAARPGETRQQAPVTDKAKLDKAAADLKAQLGQWADAAAKNTAQTYVKFNSDEPANGKFAHDTQTSKLLDGVNDVKGTKNCQPCVVATVLRAMGVDASARNVAGKDLPMAKMEAFFGSKFEPMRLGEIFKTMGSAKDGAMAVIHGVRDNGRDGHVFTARKVDGRVHFEDGQTGKRANFAADYSSFRFMQVK